MVKSSSPVPPVPSAGIESKASDPDCLPIRMTSVVIKGFGRGSKDLGIPTANLSRDDLQCSMPFESLPTGIYWGFARIHQPIGSNDKSEKNLDSADNDNNSSSLPLDTCGEKVISIFKAAISIGYNPCYGNKEKTIEPHLIAPVGHPLRSASACNETEFDNLYNFAIRLSIVGYLRPELPFEGLEKLVEAIKNDIVQTELMCSRSNKLTTAEKNWVCSDQDAKTT